MASGPPASASSSRVIGTVILVRFLSDTGARLLYPFLPLVAREVGIPLEDAGLLIAAMVTTGLLAPLFGPLTDRWGAHRVSVASQAGFAVAALVAAAGGSRASLLAALGVMGLCRAILVPALQAELSARFAYQVRGRAFATTEMAWGLAALVGFPVVGALIAATGTFRTAYLLIGLLGAILLPLQWAVLRPRPELPAAEQFQAEPFRPHAGLWASLGIAFLLLLSFNIILVAYGAWAEDSFGLDPAGLGLLSLTIGLGEVSGAVAAGLWIDRMGKRRGFFLSAAASAALFWALPLSSLGVAWAIPALFLASLAFEFAFNAFLPLASEQIPTARGRVLTAILGAFQAGNLVGSLVALRLLLSAGFGSNGLLAAGGMLLAASTVRWVREEDGAS